MNTNCEACGDQLSKGVYFNSMRLRGVAFCIPCQVIDRIHRYGVKDFRVTGQHLMNRFHVTTELIADKMNETYWLKKLSRETIELFISS